MNFENKLYNLDLEIAIKEDLPWELLENKTILITGACGLIGSIIVDLIMKKNIIFPSSNIKVLALGRNEEEAKIRFKSYLENDNFVFIKQDITQEINLNQKADYIIHAASNAHPAAYSKDPVNTILSNIIGVDNLFKFAMKNNTSRILFVSSGEVYGKLRDTDKIDSFDEEFRGYINNLDLRSGYPISKQAAENLCIAYSEQYNIESVIVRPCHIYGPNFTDRDSRAYAQFIRNAINGENIIMKSKGTQIRSYCYVLDCAVGILFALLKGENKNAYNISNKNSYLTIFELATKIAEKSNLKVVFEEANEEEKKGYNKMENSVLNSEKLEKLGWKPYYSIEMGIEHTIKILKGLDI